MYLTRKMKYNRELRMEWDNQMGRKNEKRRVKKEYQEGQLKLRAIGGL